MCRSKTKAIFNLYFVNAILKALWASSEYCKSDLLAILQYTHIPIIIGKMQVFHYFIRQLLKCFFQLYAFYNSPSEMCFKANIIQLTVTLALSIAFWKPDKGLPSINWRAKLCQSKSQNDSYLWHCSQLCQFSWKIQV